MILTLGVVALGLSSDDASSWVSVGAINGEGGLLLSLPWIPPLPPDDAGGGGGGGCCCDGAVSTAAGPLDGASSPPSRGERYDYFLILITKI